MAKEIVIGKYHLNRGSFELIRLPISDETDKCYYSGVTRIRKATIGKPMYIKNAGYYKGDDPLICVEMVDAGKEEIKTAIVSWFEQKAKEVSKCLL